MLGRRLVGSNLRDLVDDRLRGRRFVCRRKVALIDYENTLFDSGVL